MRSDVENEGIFPDVHRDNAPNDPQEEQIFTPSCVHWKALVLSFQMSQNQLQIPWFDKVMVL